MATYNIKNQEDFNRVYSKAPVKERGRLGMAFPDYYQNYQAMDIKNYQEAMKVKKAEKEAEGRRQIDQALKQDIKEETLKAIAGKPNKYYKPFENQEQRNKYAAYLKQQQQKKSAPKFSNQYQQMVYDEAIRQGIDPNLAMAVAYHESKFNPNAKNISNGDPAKGTGKEASYGLFQINAIAHPDYKGGTDPKQNIAYGISLLKGHLKATGGDIKKALARYNGSGVAARNYANTVYGIYQDFSKGNIPNTPGVTYNPSSQPQSTQTSQLIQASQIDLKEFKNFLDNNYTSQDAQEGALNNSYDISDIDLNRPALMGQLMASNLNNNNPANDYYKASNQYYQNAFDLARQAGGYGTQPIEQVQQPQQEGQEQMVDINPYNQIRGYADIAGSNQPQNIRPDVLNDYLTLMNSLRGKQDQQNQAMMQQMMQAQQQDAIQNQINQNLNRMAATRQAPFTMTQFVPGHTNMSIQYGNDVQIPMLPTDSTGNMEKFKNQMAIQAKAQQNDKDMLDRFQAMIAADEMSKVTGLPAGIFLDKDLYKTYAQYIQNPEIAEQAQFKRESGMVPLNLSADLSKQSLKNAGDVDVANINAQATLGKTGLAGEYTLANTQLANAMQGANDYRRALLQSQTQKDINKANLTAQVLIANMNAENKLKIAEQYGANALELAQLQDDLYSGNPVRIQNANAQLTNAMANLMILNNNPEQGFELYNRIINMGNNPTQAPTGELDLGLWSN